MSGVRKIPQRIRACSICARRPRRVSSGCVQPGRPATVGLRVRWEGAAPENEGTQFWRGAPRPTRRFVEMRRWQRGNRPAAPAAGAAAPPRVTRRGLTSAGMGAAGAAAILAACAPMGDAAPKSDSTKPLTLRWGYYAEQPVIDTVKKTLPVFLAKHSNYTINEEVNKQSGLDYAPQLASGDAPDVMAICC